MTQTVLQFSDPRGLYLWDAAEGCYTKEQPVRKAKRTAFALVAPVPRPVGAEARERREARIREVLAAKAEKERARQ